jgi:diguanylate cyclase (GGDEF)-like protein
VGWILPGGALLAAALLTGALAPAPFLGQVTLGYPWVALAVAFLLATLFHRSRAAVLAVALGAAMWFRARGALGTDDAAVVLSALAALAGVMAFTRDRGVIAPGGLAQAGAALALGLVAAGLAAAAPAGFDGFLSARHLPAWMTGWSGLPEGPTLVVALGTGAAAYGALRWRGPVERAVFWWVVLAVAALHPATGPRSSLLFLLAAALTLALSVVETSYALAYRDELTGLPARRALLRDLDGMGSRYTAAMVDVDHFKKFNDRHGHDVGDQVLRMVAFRLAGAGGGGRAYRYGGEEFTLLFPGRTREEALPFLEKVRADVEGSSFAVRSWTRPREKPEGGRAKTGAATKHLSVTVSIGVAEATGRDDESEAVLKRADQALYRAKKAGRNRVAK